MSSCINVLNKQINKRGFIKSNIGLQQAPLTTLRAIEFSLPNLLTVVKTKFLLFVDD